MNPKSFVRLGSLTVRAASKAVTVTVLADLLVTVTEPASVLESTLISTAVKVPRPVSNFPSRKSEEFTPTDFVSENETVAAVAEVARKAAARPVRSEVLTMCCA